MTRRELLIGGATAFAAAGMPRFVAASDATGASLPLIGSAPVLMNPAERTMDVVFALNEEASGKLFKAVYAAGCNMGIGHEPNGGVTTLEIPTSELPPGEALTVAVRPLTSLGTSGRPIAAELYRTADVLSVDAVAEKKGELS
ncbi:MAG: hypothetical protein IJG18_10915 [Kiritimatiellae bacterium]|nr:hypothetical protein [Kiritimatiellia bacterium]